MIRVYVLILTFLAAPLWAQSVAVTSGEHDGFTRVVLNFGMPVDWQFGRTQDGYEFRKSGAAVDYDLGPVFKRIGKTRLAAISAQPGSNVLNIGFACACHAIPFEFRPGIIVIDLRDGPPPKGSSFENALPDLAQQSTPDPQVAAQEQGGKIYNWADQLFAQMTVQKSTPPPALFAAPMLEPSLQPLRNQLLQQLSRGAAEGVVDLELPNPAGQSAPQKGIASARVSVGEMPGVTIAPSDKPRQKLGDLGVICAPASDLNIDSWGSDGPISEQFSTAYMGILGEFDRPEPKAVLQGVRFLIHIGFGLEARQMISTFMPDADQADMLRAMALITDGNTDADGFFQGQASCDTPAALWAFLAMDQVTQGDLVNEKAIILAFSNLPAALRRQLGPAVVGKFLAMADMSSANSIRSAILRAGGPKTADLAMIEAQIDMAQGDPAAAQSNLEAAYEQAGTAKVDALIGLVDSMVAQGLPMDRKIAEQLAAMQSELAGLAEAPAVLRALALAQASSGDFAAAFSSAGQDQDLQHQIWDILAPLGQDADILTYGVRDGADIPRELTIATASQIADRLRDLGLPDAALSWVDTYPKMDANIRARVHLDRSDGRAALLAAREIEDGAAMQARALQLLGEHAASAAEFSKLDDPEAQGFAYAKAGQWDMLRNQPPNIWTPALTAMTQQAPSNLPPLAAGQQLLANSADTRAALADLLAKVPAAQ